MLAILNKKFRQYSRRNAEFTHLKIFINYSLLAAIKMDVSKSAVTATGFTTEDISLNGCE